jgi:hypothetical protein
MSEVNHQPQPSAIPVGEPCRRWSILLTCLAVLLLGPLTVWAAAALYFDTRIDWLRVPMASAYLLLCLTMWLLLKGLRRKVIATAGVFLAVLAWWLCLKPSNDRNWQPDVRVLASAHIDGDTVTVRNIRNCNYRSETDFDVQYYEKVFSLSRLRAADLYMVYWGSPHMAHTMVSFAFEGGDYLCLSIETRKEMGEGYSALRGLFRQFELIYVVADERDLVRLRTNYRQGEDAYVFRLQGSPDRVRRFFLEYMKRLNSLHDRPEWYNAITDNCTSSIRTQRSAAERAPWDWRMLVNGHGDELLYERGLIVTNLPLAELKQRAHVNLRAKAADQQPEFSRLIRQDVPGMAP